MGATMGMYDHLNESDPVQMPGTMSDLVRCVMDRNYGEHRFLSELVRQRKADPYYKDAGQFREHTDALEALLNAGYF